MKQNHEHQNQYHENQNYEHQNQEHQHNEIWKNEVRNREAYELIAAMQKQPPEDCIHIVMEQRPNQEQEARLRHAEQLLAEERERRMMAEAALDAQRTKVLMADALSGCEESIKVHEMATILFQSGIDIGEERLYQWLRENGYVYRQGCGQNMPSQRSLELGVMELQKYLLVSASGRKSVIKTAMITPKGKEYFLNLLTSQKDVDSASGAAKRKNGHKQHKQAHKSA